MSLFKKIGKSINDAEKKGRDLARQAQQKAKDLQAQAEKLKKEADQKAKDLANATSNEAKKLAQKAHDDAQKALDHAKSLANAAGKDLKNANSKVKKRLHDLGGKVRKAYKKLLRKATLSGIYSLIRINAHGTATLLSPAISTASINTNRKIKASFFPTSKSAYAKVLARWTSLGGKQDKLDEAIRHGATLNIAKHTATANYYPVSTHTTLVGHNFKKPIKTGFDGDVTRYSLPFPNNNRMSNFIQNQSDSLQIPVSSNYKVEIFSGMDSTTSTDPSSVSDETLTPDEQSALNDYSITDAQPEEKQSHWKAFIAWIVSLFHKKETPYEDGSTQDKAFTDQQTVDAATAPELTPEDEANLSQIAITTADPLDTGDSTLDLKTSDDGTTPPPAPDDKIWGINKYVVYIGGTALAGGAVWGIIKLVQHFRKKK